MKKVLKILFLFSGLFIFLGAILFGIGFLGADGRLKNLSHLTTETYAYTEKADTEIDRVTISYETYTRIHVQLSESATQISISYERLVTKSGKSAGTVTLSDDNGHLQLKETRTWKEKFRTLGWDSAFNKLNINVVLPANRTYDLAIYTDTGDVVLDGDVCNVRSLTIIGDTSDIYMHNANIVCDGNVKLGTDTGDITLGNLSANNVSIETDTGDIEFFGKISANAIGIETDTGDVKTKGPALLDSELIILETDTGDVGVKLAGTKLDYTITVDVDTGDTNVHNQLGGERKLTINVDTGDIYVTFEK